MTFLQELRRRNVFRVAIAYLAAAWLVTEVAGTLFPEFGVPDWGVRFVVIVFALGFIPTLVFSWVFELTPEGLKREKQLDRTPSIDHRAARRLDVITIALVSIALAFIVFDRFWLRSERVVPSPASVDTVFEQETGDGAIQAESEYPSNSIAVLPFINMSDDPGNEYFSDGLTEELLNTLVRIGGLKVTGRMSSFAFKGQNQDLREVGRLLSVANVLEGSVRKAGTRVRITAQLVKTSDGYHIWSDTFDRELTDIFAIQQEIAERVTRALRNTILADGSNGAPSITLARHDPVAYEEYLRGLYLLQSSPDDRDHLELARQHFLNALAIDPDYVEANWGMFFNWNQMNQNGHGAFTESLAQMEHYAEKLQRIAPGSDRTLSAVARMAIVNYRFEEGVEYLEQAVRENPGNARVLGEYASALATLNRYTVALNAIEKASELDPLSLAVMRLKSFVYHRTGECELAEQLTRRALEMDPEAGRFRYYLAMCLYENRGEIDRALSLVETEPLDWARITALSILYHANGETERAQKQLENMMATFGDAAAYQYAQVYSQWGEIDKAIEWLEWAIEVGDPGVLQAAHDRLFNPLHGDPRYEQILRETRFENPIIH
ncbi:MAG: tetratricopeptide repeat protein [Xanthomonadales bacterium]|jgi:serine/threonine-protein kinase|nr:tetratricopeptide repeat protein [Xanthomonadales bacterium]